jgi:hypothetical protein
MSNIQESPNNSSNEKSKTIVLNTITILGLIFLAPVGVILMFAFKLWSKKTRIIVTSVVAVLFIFSMMDSYITELQDSKRTFEVEFGISCQSDQTSIILSGFTNLPDNTVIQAVAYKEGNLSSNCQGKAFVSNGEFNLVLDSFHANLSGSKKPVTNGVYEISYKMYPKDQPDDVLQVIGENGKYLRGEIITAPKQKDIRYISEKGRITVTGAKPPRDDTPRFAYYINQADTYYHEMINNGDRIGPKIDSLRDEFYAEFPFALHDYDGECYYSRTDTSEALVQLKFMWVDSSFGRNFYSSQFAEGRTRFLKCLATAKESLQKDRKAIAEINSLTQN